MMPSNLAWSNVAVGDRLPSLAFPISLKTLMLEVAGTRDFMPYHYHSGYAQTIGARGAFVNSMFLQALFARFACDWSGPDSQLLSASLEIRDQLCVGDVANVDGSVTRKWTDHDDSCVELNLVIRNEVGVTATSTTVLAMPAQPGEQVRVTGRDLTIGGVAAPDGMPDEARAQLGKQTVAHFPYPVSEAQIMYWCEMVRDANPLFQDSGYAVASRFGGITAPPVSLLIWSKDRATQIGVSPDHPDVDLPDQPAWPARLDVPQGGYRLAHVTDVIAQNIVVRTGAPIRPGHRIDVTSEMLSCTSLKRTKLGLGYFVSFGDTYRTDDGVIAGHVTKTILQYGVPEDIARWEGLLGSADAR
jgi:hypothetical protein